MLRARKSRGVMLILLAVLFVSCGRGAERTIGDGGLISAKPCGAPCFQGVTPDKTDESQLKRIINETNALSECTWYDHTASGGNRGVVCQNANFSIDEERVAGLGFIPSREIQLQEVIQKYGNPDRVIVREENLPDSPTQSSMRLLYDSLCLDIMTERQDGHLYHLSAQTLVSEVGYEGAEFCGKNKGLVSAVPWQGFGDYPLISP